ncbi:MAG TPA: hypothetical protein VJ783_20425 [Pirellulales bacterium]|nr:hypothetical protein [Pirellulales bacterium]
MNESQINQLTNPEVLIDRLAAGELDRASRRALFERLDREPTQWRRCALALLEARELDQALADWQAEIPRTSPAISPLRRVGTAHHVAENEIAIRKQSRRWPNVLALAASLLIAFGLGVGARGVWRDPAPAVAQKFGTPTAEDRPHATDASKTVASSEPPAASPPHSALVAAASAASSGEARNLVSPYVRSLLERRGYEVESRHAVVPAILPDGRRVMLPVDQFQLRYVGHRTS